MQQAKKACSVLFFFGSDNTSKIRPALAFKDTDKMINAFCVVAELLQYFCSSAPVMLLLLLLFFL